jgi:putative inorganic carbon (HCO3(-)) transporter
MRDVFFAVFISFGVLTTLRAPFVGLMLWALISLMAPHQEIYHLYAQPWNLIVAVVTIAAWLLSSEPKLPPRGPTTILVLALLSWTTINTFFAFNPEYSWLFWDRAWKIVAMAMLAAILTTSIVRFHALMWVVVLALGYYGVKGGIFTLVSGGHYHVFGPPGTMIADNNSLAGALLMILPIMNYLQKNSDVRLIRIGIITAMVLVVTAILGSYSRGAFIGLAALGLAFWLRTRHKLVFPIIALIVLLPLLHFMPESFFSRAASIEDYSSDTSVTSRFDSWWVAYRYAMDHFPFGCGFYGMILRGVWEPYIPGRSLAAHSIYFQVLGEQGVIGLVLYLLTIASCFLNLRAVRRETKALPSRTSTRDLAEMMQLSMLSFCVCGAALPIDFFDLFFLWAMLSARLREMTRQEKTSRLAEGGLLGQWAPMPQLLRKPLA